jgi:hypothetical protein
MCDVHSATREERALQRWNEVNRVWSSFAQRMTKAVGKPESALAIGRTDHHRRRIEELDTILKATPAEMRAGSQSWQMGL